MNAVYLKPLLLLGKKIVDSPIVSKIKEIESSPPHCLSHTYKDSMIGTVSVTNARYWNLKYHGND